MIEKQKYRRNSFAADYGTKEDDIILADLDLMLDEEEPSPVPLNHFMDDEDVIDRLLVDAGFDAYNELELDNGKPETLEIDDMNPADERDVNFYGHNTMATDKAISDSKSSKLALEKEDATTLMVQEESAETGNQEPIKPEHVFDSLNNTEKNDLNLSGTDQENFKKLIQDYENKAKKAAVITYASLGFGFVALLATVIMGVIVFGVQTKVAKLSDLVSILEEDMGAIAGKNSDLEINTSDASIEQLNKKLNGQPELLEEPTQSSTDIAENANKAKNKQQTRTPLPENKKPSEASVKKASTEKTAGKTQRTAGWSVNLTAYEDQSYAKNKAAKFLQKGIPVKVIAVEMNNAKWYRLKVGGFKSKEEATAYAAKIKKSLNLSSVSVVEK